MRGSIHPARLTRSWRARLLAAALLLSVVPVAGCTGSSGTTAHGAATASGAATPAGVGLDCLLPPASCYAPHVFQVAYGIRPLLDRGIDGRGETMTVLEPGPSSAAPFTLPPGVTPSPGQAPPASTDIRQDLTAFDSMFGLPAARIQVVTTLAGPGSPWQAGEEEVQDTEMVHAAAPAATLRVVLLPSNVLQNAATAAADMIAGLRLAVSGTDVASISWSLGEHFFTTAQAAQLNSVLAGAAARHVTVVATSGDNGAFSDAWFGGTPAKEASLPASDPLVLAAGGTTLTADPFTGAYISETAWNGQAGPSQAPGASGGGFSHLYARPAYQDGVPGTGAMRGVPDVAADADQQGGSPVVLTGGGKTWITSAGGTSGSAPLWAGLIALADQDAHHDLGSVNPAIYRIARSSSYHQAFHDITTGSNIQTMPYPGGTAGWQAAPGWDPVTGWGSPDAQVLVPLLARLTSPSTR
ncbi:MAG: S53 family peptidase [Streptosporangiaceae bacterium]